MESVDLKALFVGTKPGGCVESHLKAFAADLISAGYAKLPVQDYVRSAAHLGRWMDLRKLGLEQLGEEVIAEFAQHECACHSASRRGQRPAVRYVKRVRRFVMYLARQKVIPPLAQSKPRPVPTPLEGFSTWMTQHRGLRSSRSFDNSFPVVTARERLPYTRGVLVILLQMPALIRKS